jgi:hypothetical protein
VQPLGQPQIYKRRWKTNTRMHPIGEGVQTFISRAEKYSWRQDWALQVEERGSEEAN